MLRPAGHKSKASPSKHAERAAVAPAVSDHEQQEAVVPAVPEQQGAWRDPVTLQGQGQSESSGQPIAVSEYPKTTRPERVVKRPQYLKDFHTET